MFKRKDTLWKGAIEDFPKSFIRFFYKDDVSKFISLRHRLEFWNTELAQIAPDREFMEESKVADVLLKGQSTIRELGWVLVLTEVQGYSDPGFADRALTYFSRLVDKYGKRVMLLVIYTDMVKSFRPSFAGYKVGNTILKLEFQTYKVLDQDEVTLAADNNIFGLIVLTALLGIKHEIKGTDATLLQSKIFLLKNLKKRALPPKQEAKVLTFIQLYTNFADPKMQAKFDKEIELITGKTKDMGIIDCAILFAEERGLERGIRRGLEQGVESKSTSVVKNLLMKGKLTIKEIAEVAEVSVDFVRNTKKQLSHAR